jgi:hypothetical protein
MQAERRSLFPQDVSFGLEVGFGSSCESTNSDGNICDVQIKT